jgi:hypothetical protein
MSLRAAWERQLIGKCKNVKTSFFSKWPSGESRGRQLVAAAGGSEVSTVSERATSTRSLFPVFSSGRTQNLHPSELPS